jgi:monoterpene epsilon-lactone hydrolase
MTAVAPSLANSVWHEEHLLDRAAMLAMRAMLAVQPAADLGPGGRTAFDDPMEKIPAADGVSYEAAQVGGVRGWWCRPAETKPGAAILYLHGGAYVVGSAKGFRHFAGQIAARVWTDAFVADYGLAPEQPFPAAVDDAEAAYRGLASAGYSRIAIVGDSSGGGLALVTTACMTAEARHGSVPLPAAAVVMSPWTDLALTGASITARAKHDPLLTRGALENAREMYLGEMDTTDPRASPLYGDLTGLPPVLLHVGEDEILLDDARRYAELLVKSGSVAELHIWKGMVHVFPSNPALLRAAREALDLLGAFLRHNIGR